jgi:hypothetical protein
MAHDLARRWRRAEFFFLVRRIWLKWKQDNLVRSRSCDRAQDSADGFLSARKRAKDDCSLVPARKVQAPAFGDLLILSPRRYALAAETGANRP